MPRRTSVRRGRRGTSTRRTSKGSKGKPRARRASSRQSSAPATRRSTRSSSRSSSSNTTSTRSNASSKTEVKAPHFRRNLVAFICLVVGAFSGMYLFFTRVMPDLDTPECNQLSLPYVMNMAPGLDRVAVYTHGTTPPDAAERATMYKAAAQCARDYQQGHASYVLAAFCVVYIVLQALAIPGPIVLSVLAGALYPIIPAQLLIAFCATTGASLCFMMSYFLGTDLTAMLIPDMVARFRAKIESNRDNLVYYMFFLRLTPMLPNWFVNVASPVVEVPFYMFFGATFIGLMPANYFHVQTGALLSTLTELSFGNFDVLLKLFLLQFVALIPTLFKKRLAAIDDAKFGADGKGKGSTA